ncbi:MAG: polysulfide reductase NrfD, partial [Chloroflexia bacterium]|nr:polysulfide reductase NrfD [Chloroflexia bacterium]
PATRDLQAFSSPTPVIHGPHWKWLIIGYFWTGGIAAGSLAVASIARLTGDARVARLGRYVACAALLPSPPLLVLDLGRPERFWRMVSHVNPRSPMSLGSWDLVVFSGCCTLSALRQAATDGLPGTAPARRLPDRALAILSLPPALFLGGYTGILLGATAVPLWARLSRLLGPLFLASAMSTGAAATALLEAASDGTDRATRERLSRIEATGGAAELAIFGVALARDREVRAALTRWPLHRLLLAGVIACIVAPRLLALLEGRPAAERRTAVHVTGPVLSLAGGFLLRTLMVLAGRDSADDPDATFRLAGRKRPLP